MAKANMKIQLSASAEQVWKVITDNKNYGWRSDLDRIEEMGDGKTFVEYTKSGFPTTFTITKKVPFCRYEFDMENENMKGHWTGLLRESGNGTEIDFTEDVELKKPFMKFAAGMYLKRQQKKYAEDLKKELGVIEVTEAWVREKVHKLYWEDDINCAGTMLRCLSEAFDVKLDCQVLSAAAGMRGAGGYGAQCGLVEGALLFIGIYCGLTGAGCEKAADYCCEYAKAFENKFGSLRCHDLRPGGFTEQDPLHLCEKITCEAVLFACGFVRERMECQKEEQLYRTDTGEVILRMAGREEMQALTEIRMAYLWDEHGHLEQEMEDMMRRQLSGYFERHLGRDFHAFVAVDAHGAMTASAFLLVTERPAKPDCISGKNGTVLNVYTKPACRRQGIAGRLIEMLLKKAEDMGMDYVDLKATEEGYGLYKKMGFEDGKSDYFDMRYWIGQGNTDG